MSKHHKRLNEMSVFKTRENIGHYIIFKPKESREVLVLWCHMERMEHLLHVAHRCYVFMAEADKDSN